MRKFIAPIIIGIVVISYFLLIMIPIMREGQLILKLCSGVMFAGLAYALVKVVVLRIREIKEEENDDLSKY